MVLGEEFRQLLLLNCDAQRTGAKARTDRLYTVNSGPRDTVFQKSKRNKDFLKLFVWGMLVPPPPCCVGQRTTCVGWCSLSVMRVPKIDFRSSVLMAMHLYLLSNFISPKVVFFKTTKIDLTMSSL